MSRILAFQIVAVCQQDAQNVRPARPQRSEEARRALRYVEPLSDVRTMLADIFSILLVFDRSLERLLDARNLTLQTSCVAFPIINFDCAGNAAAIFPHALITLFHDGKYLIPFPLEHCPHRVQPVVHSALIYNIERARHILTDTLAFA